MQGLGLSIYEVSSFLGHLGLKSLVHVKPEPAIHHGRARVQEAGGGLRDELRLVLVLIATHDSHHLVVAVVAFLVVLGPTHHQGLSRTLGFLPCLELRLLDLFLMLALLNEGLVQLIDFGSHELHPEHWVLARWIKHPLLPKQFKDFSVGVSLCRLSGTILHLVVVSARRHQEGVKHAAQCLFLSLHLLEQGCLRLTVVTLYLANRGQLGTAWECSRVVL